MPVTTIKDIAEIAGVSVQTVSRALNDRPDISDATKEKIASIAAELNYRRNIRAASLRTKKSKTIGIIIPDFRDDAHAEVLQGCNNTAIEKGYQIIIYAQTQRGVAVDKDIEAFHTLVAQQVDGLLLLPEHEDERFIKLLKQSPVPFVLYNRYDPGFECDFVTSDHQKGAYLATDYLFKKGYGKIHFFIRYPRYTSVDRKIAGCLQAARENGLSKNSIVLIDCGDHVEDAYLKAAQLLKQVKKSKAIYAWDDEMAFGITRAIFEKGLHFPEDIELIGHNDIEKAKYFTPPLTTIKERMLEVGEKATELLIQKIESRHQRNRVQHIILSPELIVRKTTS